MIPASGHHLDHPWIDFGLERLKWSLLVALLWLLLLQSVQAAEWRFRPRVTVGETYSDNINLSATNAESEFVTNISPGFSLNGVGRRFFLNVFYNLQYLNYARNTRKDQFRNQFQLVGNGEVAEDLFFIDLRGSVRQTIIAPQLNAPIDTLTASDNVANTYTYGISPYLVHRFGSFMDGEARYAYDAVENSTGRSDSEAHTVFLNLKSGEQFQSFTWDTYYRYYKQIPEFGQNVTFERVQGDGRYRFNRKIAALFGTGYEDNEFISLEDTTAVTWMAGLSLTPNRRTLIEGGAENRFFGVAPFLRISYTSKRTALAVNYYEDVTTTNKQISETALVPLVDAFGNPILDPNTGEAIEIPLDTAGIRNEVYVQKRIDGSLTVQGQRTTVGATLFGTQRNYQISPDEDVYGITLFASRRISRPTTVRVWGNVTESKFDGPSADRTRWRAGVGLIHQFSKDFSGTLDYAYTTQTSGDPNLEFDENRVTVLLNKYF